MNLLSWIEAFKAAGDTKTAMVLVLFFGIGTGIWLAFLYHKLISKDRFFQIIGELGNTIEANTSKAFAAAKEASNQCKEETNLVKLSLEGHQSVVTDLTKAVAELSGQFKQFSHNFAPKTRRRKS